MAEEDLKKKDAVADAAKADAEAGEKLDKVLSCLDSVTKSMDSIGKRMDAFEEKEAAADKKRKDAEEEDEKKKKADAAKADGAKKDDDSKKKDDDDSKKKDAAKSDAEKEEEEKKADKKRKDAEEEEKKAADKKRKDDDDDAKKKDAAKADSDDIRKRIADVEAKLPKQMSDAESYAMADAQSRADSVFCALGSRAPIALQGETLAGYRKRLAGLLKGHSNTWKGVDLAAFADDTAFSIAEGQIYADAMSAALNPVDIPENTLREVMRTDPTTGQRQTVFYGKNTFISQLKRPSRRVVNIGIRKEG